jgi:O-6-methylguanine DNA methyltransferase
MHAMAIETGDGVFLARYSERGLCELNFPAMTEVGVNEAADREVLEWHQITSLAVAAILVGEDPEEVPPLDLSGHTEFRRSVWAAMRRIPRGKTVSYTELARSIGEPNARRAVGGACGANPIPLIVPCHRVLAAGQRLGGFSGGLRWKRKLLAVEGIGYVPEPARSEMRDHAEQGELIGLGRSDF